MRLDKIPSVFTFAVFTATCASSPPGIMSFDAYRQVEHPTPYVLELATSADHQLLYYGSAHVYVADDPQIVDIQARWSQFKPTFALNEGGNPPVLETLEETVGRNGESGLVRWLAKRDGVPVESIDPTRANSVAASRARFTAEQIKLSAVLGQVAEQRRRTESFRMADLDAEVTRVLNLLSRVPGLEGPPRSLQEVETSAARLLPRLTNWRNVPSDWFDPAVNPPIAWTNQLSKFNNEYRDEFMVQRILARLREGHRVFVVVGATHLVMQERELRWRVQQEVRAANTP